MRKNNDKKVMFLRFFESKTNEDRLRMTKEWLIFFEGKFYNAQTQNDIKKCHPELYFFG